MNTMTELNLITTALLNDENIVTHTPIKDISTTISMAITDLIHNQIWPDSIIISPSVVPDLPNLVCDCAKRTIHIDGCVVSIVDIPDKNVFAIVYDSYAVQIDPKYKNSMTKDGIRYEAGAKVTNRSAVRACAYTTPV